MNQYPQVQIETTHGEQPQEADRGWIEQSRLQAPADLPHQTLLQRSKAWLRSRLNGRNPSTIETLAFPRPLPEGQIRVDGRFAVEQHHHSYRRRWCLGRDHFDYLVSRGLQPHHSVLDFGCGCLRTGVWLIGYLEPGRYFGLDSHYKSLEAAATYEIPLHGLEAKHPRLLWNRSFECEHFGEQFDFILAFSVLNWLEKQEAFVALDHLIATLRPGGRIITYVDSRIAEQELRSRCGLVVAHRGRHESKFFHELSDFTEFALESEQAGMPRRSLRGLRRMRRLSPCGREYTRLQFPPHEP